MTMKVDKSKLKEPLNTEENREILVETLLNDMSTKEMREHIRNEFLKTFRTSRTTFLKEYWKYYEETYGHCPFGLNSD